MRCADGLLHDGHGKKDEPKVTCLGAIETHKGMAMTCQVDQKGAGEGFAVSMVLAVLPYLGPATVMLQTDPEPAIMQVAREVQKTRPAD